MDSEMESVVSRRGRITIPAAIRRALGLRVGDRVAMVIDGQDVRLRRKPGAMESTAGVFRQSGVPGSAEQLRQAAEAAIAEGRRPACGAGH